MEQSAPPPLPEVTATGRKRPLLGRPARVILIAVAALAAVVLVVLPVLGLIRYLSVPTQGMAPAIEAGDRIVAERITYWRTQPKRGDIVAFKTDDIPMINSAGLYAKRLVGLPGDRLRLTDEDLYVNGERMFLPNNVRYANGARGSYLSDKEQTIIVPEGRYFVLGDNILRSSDSRYWGFVPADAVVGRVVFCYWPPGHWGPIQ